MIQLIKEISVLTVLVLFGISCSTPKYTAFSEDQNKTIDPKQSKIDSLCQVYNIIGLAAAEIGIGDIAIYKYGHNNNLKAHPIVDSTKFHLGSNTKAITAHIIAEKVEIGIIGYHNTIGEVLGESLDSINPSYLGMTLGDLLSHRAKVQAFTSGLAYMLIPEITGEKIMDKRLHFVVEALKLEPVESNNPYEYSNAGYAIAACMLEKLSGKSWEDHVSEFMNKNEFDFCLGMPNKSNSHHAWGHGNLGKGFKAMPPSHPYQLQDYVGPAGDISMSIQDYSKYIQKQLNGLLNGDQDLTKSAYNKMHYGLDGYAYGWLNTDMSTADAKFSVHNGSIGTYYSTAYVVPYREKASVILINSVDNNTARIVEEISLLLLE